MHIEFVAAVTLSIKHYGIMTMKLTKVGMYEYIQHAQRILFGNGYAI